MKNVTAYLRHAVIILIICTTVVSCSKEKSASNQDLFASDSTLVAIVDGLNITYDDISETAKTMISQNRITPTIDYRDSLIQHESLEWIISNELLKKEVLNHTIEVLDAEIDRGVEMIRNNFPNEAAFEEALRMDGHTLRQFREQVASGIKIQKLLEQEVFNKDYSVDESEAKSYYTKNPDQFAKNAKIRVRQILVKIPRTASEAEVADAMRKINTIRQRIQQGEDFAAVAQRYSEDVSAQKGGDIGFFERGDLLPEFDAAAFSLRDNEVSDIVRTNLGFHLIKLIETQKSKTTPFDEVKEELIDFLKQKKTNDALKKYIDDLKSKADIVIKQNWYKQ